MSTIVDLEQEPLDELSRFQQLEQEAVAEETAEPAEVLEESKPKRFRREIDLGDGSGKQVFEGATVDELLEKLTTAQANATKKIREQNATLRSLFPDGKKPEVVEEPEPKNDAERIARLERKLRERESADQWNEITTTFVQLHPEYEATPKNGTRILRYMKAEGIPSTLEGIEKAFAELTADGLLTVREENDEEETEPTERIASEPAAKPQKKVASGLSGRDTRLSRRVARVALTEKEIDKLPEDQWRKQMQAFFTS